MVFVVSDGCVCNVDTALLLSATVVFEVFVVFPPVDAAVGNATVTLEFGALVDKLVCNVGREL